MENFDEVAKRGSEFLENLVSTYDEKRILVVSHGALIGLTLQQLLPERFQQTYINNTALTIVNFFEGKWDCTLYNCTAHLM